MVGHNADEPRLALQTVAPRRSALHRLLAMGTGLLAAAGVVAPAGATPRRRANGAAQSRTGANGPNGTVARTQTIASAATQGGPGQTIAVRVSCPKAPAGQQVALIGGGYRVVNLALTTPLPVPVPLNYPDGTTWVVTAINTTNEDAVVFGYAICQYVIA
jgi:hypothetical protein